ncbi:penicillin-binding protein activator [Psychromonas sp. MME2]|uniref:penicillin-binding protein activator n=1 Tax=unclassified Psychromonas TaxID=2614957 RepID=UPI00339CA271
MLHVLTSPKRFFYSLIMILTVTILSACTSTPPAPEDIPPALFSKLDYDSAYYLKKDEQLGSDKNTSWQFITLQALISEGKFTLANSIIEYLQSQPLSDTQQSELSLLLADKLYRQNRLGEAQTALNKLTSDKLSALGYLYYLKLQTKIYKESGDASGASDTLLLLIPVSSNEQEKQQYTDMLLEQLLLLPESVLNQYDENQLPAGNILSFQEIKQGWYELAILYQRYQSRANQLLHALENWQQRYPTHPALSLMPQKLTDIQELSAYEPKNIAILIPLSGRFEQQGKAIQYGLLHAFYKQQHNKESENITTQSPTLHFFDTNIQSPEQIITAMTEQNIDFVIGPLLKREVDSLLPLMAELPVLSFNSIDNEQMEENRVAWHYAFPISPEQEAKQAAQLIAQQQHKKPLIIAPNSAYGKRIADAFTTQWLTLSEQQTEQAEQAEVHLFNNKAQLAEFISGVLQIDQSKTRITQIKNLTGLPLETEVRSRRDIDAIYIVSNRDELNLIKPFIDVSISPFAKAIPLYANSRSHVVDHDGKQNKELEKITFSDINYLIDVNNTVFNEVEQVWPKQPYSTLRLFALGFDSYQLINQLIPLQNIANYNYQGLVGELTLDNSNIVQAKLSWAKYQQGNSIEIDTAITEE